MQTMLHGENLLGGRCSLCIFISVSWEEIYDKNVDFCFAISYIMLEW